MLLSETAQAHVKDVEANLDKYEDFDEALLAFMACQRLYEADQIAALNHDYGVAVKVARKSLELVEKYEDVKRLLDYIEPFHFRFKTQLLRDCHLTAALLISRDLHF